MVVRIGIGVSGCVELKIDKLIFAGIVKVSVFFYEKNKNKIVSIHQRINFYRQQLIITPKLLILLC